MAPCQAYFIKMRPLTRATLQIRCCGAALGASTFPHTNLHAMVLTSYICSSQQQQLWELDVPNLADTKNSSQDSFFRSLRGVSTIGHLCTFAASSHLWLHIDLRKQRRERGGFCKSERCPAHEGALGGAMKSIFPSNFSLQLKEKLKASWCCTCTVVIGICY